MTFPFTSPESRHVRRHGPQGYADSASCRPWLRDEFTFRCVYCLLREQWGRLRGTFALEHFLPVAHHPDQSTAYDNLLYSCATCNTAKGARNVPDPCRVLLHSVVQVKEDGTITASTAGARRLIRLLGLDEPESTEFRLMWIDIIALAARYAPALHEKLMGFPDDLPDLGRLRPPGGNTRPEGLETAYSWQRERGILPASY